MIKTTHILTIVDTARQTGFLRHGFRFFFLHLDRRLSLDVVCCRIAFVFSFGDRGLRSFVCGCEMLSGERLGWVDLLLNGSLRSLQPYEGGIIDSNTLE